MPASKPTPAQLPSNDLILAAIERAICHRGRNEPAESLSSIKEHLRLPHNGWTTLQLRPKLEALKTAGLIEKSSRRGRDVWGLTTKGRKRLDAIRTEVALPESPQHQRWSESRAAASERIAGFQTDVRGVLDEAIDLLGANREANSATWSELGDRLHDSCRRVASATYCLHEWQEPDDSTADIDDAPHRQMGRRHTRGWDCD